MVKNNFRISVRSGIDELIRDLERSTYKKDYSGLATTDTSVDPKRAYLIICSLESNCSYAIGDSGTSFGPTQVQLGSFLNGLAKNPNIEQLTGLSPNQLRDLGSDWNKLKRNLRNVDFWKKTSVDINELKHFIKNNPKDIIKRREGILVRKNPNNSPGFIKIRNGRPIGYEIDTNELRKLGLDVNKFMPQIQTIAKQYITDAVAHNGIIKLFMSQYNPETYKKFMDTFSRTNVKNNKELQNLASNVSQRNLTNKINHVLRAVKESGYDTNNPNAYNIYQLICIANGSGAGRVEQFLKRRKLFGPAHLHYLQRANSMITKITGITSKIPPNGGLAGFPNRKMIGSLKFAKNEFNEDEFDESEFDEEITINEPNWFLNEYKYRLDELMKVLRNDPELNLKIFNEFLDETGLRPFDSNIDKLFNNYLKNEVEKYVKGHPELFSKASLEKALYFPGQYINDIKESKRRMTIRANDEPVNVGEIVKCMSYSGAHTCNLLITEKNAMSTTRIRKAFGKNIANELDRKFGPNKQFIVIRFDVVNVNEADDDEKMSEVLIDKDGIKLTRGEIKKHYEKPEIRKKIMERVKDKPVLLYIGIDKNKNILKRNHNDKPIIITNDDPNKSDDPNNYFYWVKRRMLSIHQVFGNKTNIGFVDLDLHGNYSLEKAKKYAKELSKEIKNKFNTSTTIYQSGGTGLHVEFKLNEKKDIDKLRNELKELLSEVNKDWDDVTTGIVKGNGMRSDISTLHNKGSIRVPGSYGEIWGKIKKPLSQDADDFGKYTNLPESLDEDAGSLDTGALKPPPVLTTIPVENFSHFALSKRNLTKISRRLGIDEEYIWIWGDGRLLMKKNVQDEREIKGVNHLDLLNEKGLKFINDEKNPRGYITFNRDGSIEITTFGILYNEIPMVVRNRLEERFGILPGKFSISLIPTPRGHAEKIQEELYSKASKKKILILVAPEDFEELEYIIPKNLFINKFNFDVDTTSIDKEIIGKNGTVINVDYLIKDIDALKYDSLFVSGGKGMISFSKNKNAQKLLKSFIRHKKPIALLCHAPLLGAECGCLRGKEVTGWPDIIGKIKRAKGIWTGMPIERDGLLFTAMGIDDAENFAWVLANFLLGKKSLGPAKEKYLNMKEARNILNSIHKFADDEDELAKLIREQEEEMDEEETKTIEEELEEARSKVEPKKVEPKKVEPKKVEPKKVEPKKVEPKKEIKTKKPDFFKELETKQISKEEAESELNKTLQEKGEKYFSYLKNLNEEKLKDYIISPEEIEKADIESEKEYSIMLEFVIYNGHIPEDKELFEKYKEKYLQESPEELMEDFLEEFDNNPIVVNEKQKKLAIPVFSKKPLEPLKDKKGEVIDYWPKVEIPDMSKDAAEIFYSDNLVNGASLRKVFNNVRAWKILKQEPELLQKWILPSIIMAIGYRFFELNSTQRSIGKKRIKGGLKFKHLEGGAPFGMLTDLDEETTKKLEEGKLTIEQLPQSKKYIREIVKLVTEYTNVYFSKDYANLKENRDKPIPIDAYIYSALKNEMTKKIAEDNDYKEKRVPVCSICAVKYGRNKAIDQMVQIKRGVWSCPTCLKNAEAVKENDLQFVNEEISIADGYLKKLNRSLKLISNKKENIKDEQEKLILNEKEKFINDEIEKHNYKKSSLKPKIQELQNKINLLASQGNVPRWHTWCPNIKCPGKRVPLSCVDWNDEIWKTKDGDFFREKLLSTYGIKEPNIMEQSADINEKNIIRESLSWVKKIPLECPFDGVKFKMGEVEGQGDQGKAGFFWDTHTKLNWVPKAKETVEMYESLEQKGIDPNKAREQLLCYQNLSNLGQKLAREQYYKYFDNLRSLFVDIKQGKKKPIPKIQQVAKYRNLLLYDTIKNFSFEDPVSYVAWMSGSLVYSKPTISEEGISNENTLQDPLPYDKRDDLIYQPVLQRWVDNILKSGKNPYKQFDLKSWLVRQESDGIPSDGPGTYFVAKVESGIEDEGGQFYGLKCNLESKRKLTKQQLSKEWDKKGPRIVRVLDIWKLEKEDLNILTDVQKEGKDAIAKPMAEAILKKGRENKYGDLYFHDYHNISLNTTTTMLTSNNYVLVRALIMPGRSEWGPLKYIKNLEKNKEGFKFWDKFYELAVLHKDDPTYWKELSVKLENVKDYLYRAENLIDRELSLSRKASFKLSSGLKKYKEKREFDKTPEPEGKIKKEKNKYRFVIQDHFANKAGRHYDLRLENDEGTMSSWSIPKHKLPKGKEKLLAIKTEDHPISYNKFEGEIPSGYGAGKVEIEDFGTYDEMSKKPSKIVFKLKGKKNKGSYKIFKTDGNKWMIMEANENDLNKKAFLISKRN